MKITNLEQIKNINLDTNKIFYIYGKIGSGKTYLAKQIANKNNKKILYTNFNDIIHNLVIGEEIEVKNEEVIIIDEGIETVIQKELICLNLLRMLEKLQSEGKILLIIGDFTPEELKQKNESLSKFILQEEQIEICYDVENRIKIAEEYSKKCKTIINKNILKAIAKEKNLGKMKGQINQINIV